MLLPGAAGWEQPGGNEPATPCRLRSTRKPCQAGEPLAEIIVDFPRDAAPPLLGGSQPTGEPAW